MSNLNNSYLEKNLSTPRNQQFNIQLNSSLLKQQQQQLQMNSILSNMSNDSNPLINQSNLGFHFPNQSPFQNYSEPFQVHLKPNNRLVSQYAFSHNGNTNNSQTYQLLQQDKQVQHTFADISASINTRELSFPSLQHQLQSISASFGLNEKHDHSTNMNTEDRIKLKKKLHRNRTSFTHYQIEVLEKGKPNKITIHLLC